MFHQKVGRPKSTLALTHGLVTGRIRWRERQLILPQENAYEKHKSIQTAQQKRIARHLLCCTPRNGDFATLYASNLHFATAYGSKSRPHRLPFRSASSVGAATQRQHMLPGRVILWVLSQTFFDDHDRANHHSDNV